MASSITIHAGTGQLLLDRPVFGPNGCLFAAVLGSRVLIGMLRLGQKEEKIYHEE